MPADLRSIERQDLNNESTHYVNSDYGYKSALMDPVKTVGPTYFNYLGVVNVACILCLTVDHVVVLCLCHAAGHCLRKHYRLLLLSLMFCKLVRTFYANVGK